MDNTSNSSLLLLPQLGDLPADDGPLPLPEDEELEAVKVAVLTPLFAALELLGPGGGVPLGNSPLLGKNLLEGLSLGRVGNSDLKLGEGNALEVDGLAGNSGGGSVNQGLSERGREGRKIISLGTRSLGGGVCLGTNNNNNKKGMKNYPVVVNNVNNGGSLAGIGAVVDEDHAADLNKAVEKRLLGSRERKEEK